MGKNILDIALLRQQVYRAVAIILTPNSMAEKTDGLLRRRQHARNAGLQSFLFVPNATFR